MDNPNLSPDPNGMVELARNVLQEVWGYPGFRQVQEITIRRLLVDGESALVLMPTGGGKSLCYQVPALCLPGLTLVISPLIALMKDQVDALVKLGVPAASMDSSLSNEEMFEVKRQIKEGTLKLLYVAPERLNNEMFVALMQMQPIALLAVDESHCISSWGPTFRPDYLKIAQFAKLINAQRVLALTATATPAVALDVCKGFDICPDNGVFKTGNYRENLTIQIKPCANYDSKVALLVPFLKSRKSGAAIIYFTTHHDVENLVISLTAKGVPCKGYHAGMDAGTRKSVQDEFMAGEGVVCATIAFGMGIDKPDIRQVCHFMMPKSMEGYSQEIGRAGRDGQPSTCLMIPSPSDMPQLESFARGNTPSRNSIRDWLKHVFAAEPAPDNSVSFCLVGMGNEFDISRNTLGLLFAQLELQFQTHRAVTPFYNTYVLSSSNKNPNGWVQVMKEKSEEAVAIRNNWKFGTSKYTLDMVSAAEASGIERAELARQITRWEGDGSCEVKVSGVRNRYAILKKELPSTAQEIEDIADLLFNQMVEREEADVERLRGVASYISNSQCFAQGLALYFGDSTSVPGGKCKKCTVCTTTKPLHFTPACVGTVEESKVNVLLSICGVRDDPRFLARLAFGISSPRITILGLHKHVIFNSCRTSDFSLLVQRFESECSKVGFQNKAVLAPVIEKPVRSFGGWKSGNGGTGAKTTTTTAGTKRSYGSSFGSSSGGRGGWKGGYKKR